MSNKEIEARIVAVYEQHKAKASGPVIGARSGVKQRSSMQRNELARLIGPLFINLSPNTLQAKSGLLLRYMMELDSNGRTVDFSKENILWYLDGLLAAVKDDRVAATTLSHNAHTFITLLKHLGRTEDTHSLLRVKPQSTAKQMDPAKREELLARRMEREREGSFKKGRRSAT